MMASGGSHLQRPFGRMLAHHFAHVAGRRAHARGADIGVHGMRGFGNPVVRIASHQFDELSDMPHADRLDIRNETGLIKVGVRHDDCCDSLLPRMQHDGQQSVDGQYGAVKIHLAKHDGAGQTVMGDCAGRAEHAGRDGQIMRRAFLRHGRWGEIDRDTGFRPFETTCLACRLDPFARLGQ